MFLKIQLSILRYNSTSSELIMKTPPVYKMKELVKFEFKISMLKD
jgi:hypothetical protein